ncbi:glutathione hydrolase-like YwrD proenzyme [Rhipicephalus sanguineus]|uniref:glutathione hydrolase-like YwrD proenzyme n=1 Tax=Rhipicephalus sanguineus TaxID=34632 RepID=UPI0020C43AFD|nr:glutathione hydrolase-like YwrD proenzyme [Rhipicephalus sanguineus]
MLIPLDVPQGAHVSVNEAIAYVDVAVIMYGLPRLSGGNAADAAIAMAACIQVLQPYSSGLGGDCFALYYNAHRKQVDCVDGSGRSPAALSLELVQSKCHHDWAREVQMYGLQATVPGAAKAWHCIVTKFGSGKMSISELFAPAVHYAERGFPMDHEKYRSWRIRDLKLTPGGHFFLNTDRQRFANEGPRAVYEGPVAEQMVGAVVSAGGVLSTKDLSDHLASSEPLLVQPVKTTYRGDVTVHTTPLPTHGAVLLEALNILECFDLTGTDQKTTEKDKRITHMPLRVEAGFDQEVRKELEQRGHTVNVDNPDLRFYSAGHVNVLCRASKWWTKEEASSDDRQLHIDSGAIWCGVETRSCCVALGY